jgi:thiamine-phosphate pyrophosphorylase
MIALPRLYAVADRTFGDPLKLAKDLFSGGARLVQIRDKTATPAQLLEEVEEAMEHAGVAAHVLVNDRADIARLAEAAGVHLGQADLAPADARKVLGTTAIIGYSTHNLAQALEADGQPVDYIAVGPIFATTTKMNPDPVVGLDRLREVCSRVSKPVVAIGGITLATAREVLSCGATSVAVIGDILRSDNVEARTREWVRELEF